MRFGASLQRRQEAAHIGKVLRIRNGNPARRCTISREIAGGVEVVLHEVHRHRHVQHMAYGAVAIGGSCDLGNVAGDRRIGIEQSPIDQDAGETCGDGFAHGKDDMPPFGSKPVVITLRDHASALKHKKSVGECLGQQAPDGPLAAVGPLKGDTLHRPIVAPQSRGRPIGATDARCGHDFADMLKRPAIEGRPQPIRQAHLLIGRGWKPPHQWKIGHASSFPPG